MLFGADMQFSTASFLYFGISNFDRMSKRAISEVLLMTLMMTFCEGRIPGFRLAFSVAGKSGTHIEEVGPLRQAPLLGQALLQPGALHTR